MPQALLGLLGALQLPGDVLTHPEAYADEAGNFDYSKGIPAATNFAASVGGPGAFGAPEENVLNIFAGPRSKTADKVAGQGAVDQAKLMKAENALNFGSDPKATGLTDAQMNEVFASTGWFPGNDMKWRYEIPDVMRIRAGTPDITEGFNKELQDILLYQSKMGLAGSDWRKQARVQAAKTVPSIERQGSFGMFLDHPELFEAYPELAGLQTKVTAAAGKAQQGEFDPATQAITAMGQTKEDIASVLLHEAQHYIQQQEGFANGGNPEWAGQKLAELVPGAQEQLQYPKPYDIYRALMGEVEARQVQNRYELGYLSGTDPRVFGSPAVTHTDLPDAKWFNPDTPYENLIHPMWLEYPQGNLPGGEAELKKRLLAIKMMLGGLN